MNKAQWSLLFLVATLVGRPVVAEEKSSSEEIRLRLRTGYSFYSKADPVSAGGAFGADLDLEVAPKWGVGLLFNHSFGSEYQSSTSSDTKYKNTVVGLNPHYLIKRSGVSAKIGLVLGAMLTSRNIRATVGSSTVDTNDSASRFAFGINAAVDITITGAFFFTIAPMYLQSGSGGIGEGSLQGGFGFSM